MPSSAEELAVRTKFPLEIIENVGKELQTQFMISASSETGFSTKSDTEINVGLYFTGSGKTMMSTAGNIIRSQKSDLVTT